MPVARNILTVGDLNQFVKTLLESNPYLGNLYVRGEISNFKNQYLTGHLYFSLKDAGGVVGAVMFASYASRLSFKPEDGMKVMAHGRVSLYPKTGQYQFYIDDMQPDGLGALYIAFNALKEKLEREGLFDPSRKKPIPYMPMHVGIVTSETGAVIQDMKNVFSRRFPLTRLTLYPSLVQGQGAAENLSRGIRYFNAHPELADVIIIGRGGGSIEDLWAFNDESLAREIAKSRIPVISAVGHETDFTICDFVADKRAPTPSAAAELAVPDQADLFANLQEYTTRMRNALKKSLDSRALALKRFAERPVLRSPAAAWNEKAMQLDHLQDRYRHALDAHMQMRQTGLRSILSRPVFQNPGAMISPGRDRLQSLSDRADQAMRSRISQRLQHADHLKKQLDALSPLGVLQRGYSLTTDSSGRVLTSVQNIRPGDKLTVSFRDGRAIAAVEQTEKTAGGKTSDGN